MGSLNGAFSLNVVPPPWNYRGTPPSGGGNLVYMLEHPWCLQVPSSREGENLGAVSD